MPKADAVMQDDRGRTVLRFERTLDHPPDRVWRYLTEASELRGWHPSPFELEPRVGGAVRYLPTDGAAFGEGEVTEYDPPRVLAYTWGDDHLRWELESRGDGCLLVLTHTFDDHFKAARDAAGWDVCLDALGARLAGAEPEQVEWRELNRVYEEKFGIPHEKATAPPG
jgi:uncharacterized protein YndB with AHSA1/START domain